MCDAAVIVEQLAVGAVHEMHLYYSWQWIGAEYCLNDSICKESLID